MRSHNDEVAAAKRRDYLPETSHGLYNAEQVMLKELVAALGVPSTGRPQPPPSASAADLSYVCVDYDVTYRLAAGRFGLENEFMYVLRAEIDGLDRFEAAYYCPDESGELARLALYEGGALVADRLVGHPGTQIATIALPRPLHVGETHRVRFDIQYPPERQADNYCMLMIVRPTERICVRVNFDDERPRRIWRVDRVFANAGTGDADTSVELTPDSLGCVEAAFLPVTSGYLYGIAWEW